MTDEGHYQPIACGTYSEYEVAILHQQPLRLCWCDDDGVECVETLVPSDLRTEGKAEYLYALGGDGREWRIRLDRISEAHILPQA